jgi:hypothetical protein
VLQAGKFSEKISVAIVLRVGKYVTVNFCGHCSQGWKIYHSKFLLLFMLRAGNL